MQLTELTTISIGLLIGVGGLFIGFSSWQSGKIEKATLKASQDGERQGVINTKLEQIITGITNLSNEMNDLKNNFHNSLQKIEKLEVRVSALENKKTRNTKRMDIDE